MPTRDENEYTQRRDQILAGAMKVFAAKGFEKATNRDIAEAAGIGSPGLIYHYFSDKSDLFRETISRYVAVIELFNHPEEFMALAPEVALLRFTRSLLAVADSPQTAAGMRMVIGEALRRPMVSELVAQIGPRRGFALLASYLEAQMAQGRLRQMNIDVAVRAFVGPLLAFMFAREVFKLPGSEGLSSETMAQEAVALFLRGMAPDETEA